MLAAIEMLCVKENVMSYPTLELRLVCLSLESVRAQARHDVQPEETEKEYLLRMAQAGRPKLRERFLLGASDALVSWGLRLKARYQLDSATSISWGSAPFFLQYTKFYQQL